MSRRANRRRAEAKRGAAAPSGKPYNARTPDRNELHSLVAKSHRPGLKQWLFAAALLGAVFLAYRPAWNGGFVWDDDQHVTCPELRPWSGLGRIWFDVYATQQYYPLLHSAFWLEHKLWGDSPLGYHLVNILLHGVAALMVAAILRRLSVPGAYLAAAIFALHPVQVESVAWITELKNTLSAVFYLGAAMVYLRFDESRSRWLYVASLSLFVAGLLSKTVTATLPGALLVIFWWQRGRLSWRRDVLPLVPFFILGAVAGSFTAWVERSLIGAQGKPFEMGIAERFLLSGRVIWFYLGKLVWPVDLLFIYPRWTVSAAVGWQYLFPAALAALLITLWLLRRWWRGPLAATLFFIGTLFPVLGFFNVYPFIFSFVADHFQYLASLGIIALVAAGIALALMHFQLWGRPSGHAFCLILLAPLSVLTWRQCAMYADAETLYRTTIDRNPKCWMAYNNLGVLLSNRNRTGEAIECYEAVLRIQPDHANAHLNLGNALAKLGRLGDALAHYETALETRPGYVEAEIGRATVLDDQGNWDAARKRFTAALAMDREHAVAHSAFGRALAKHGEFGLAEQHFDQALKLNPRLIAAQVGLGDVLSNQGRLDEAIARYESALDLDDRDVSAHNNLGHALIKKRQVAEAMRHFTTALAIEPNDIEAMSNLGNALAITNRVDEAIATYRRALWIKPDAASVHLNLGNALSGQGRDAEAVEHFERAIQLRPDLATAHNSLGAAMARQGRIDDALAHFEQAVQHGPELPEGHQNLGNALLVTGRPGEALPHFEKALTLRPENAQSRQGIQSALAARDDLARQLAAQRQTVLSRPSDVAALNDLAWTLATCPDAMVRNGAEAIRLAEQAAQLSQRRNPAVLDTLAAAYAEAGRFADAVRTVEQAIDLAVAQNNTTLGDNLRAKRTLYSEKRPYRAIAEPPGGTP